MTTDEELLRLRASLSPLSGSIPRMARDELIAALVDKVSRYERALQAIANDETDDLFQDVAAAALGCTCSEFHKVKMMIDPACPFHVEHR